MSTNRRHTATLVATLLASTLALGACGAQTAPDDATPAPAPQEQAESRGPSTTLSEHARARLANMTLAEIRTVFPTAGDETPPATLRLPTMAEKLTANNLHTGIPRVVATDQPAGDVNGSRHPDGFQHYAE